MDENRVFMDLALEEAEKALKLDEVPVGCVVTRGLSSKYRQTGVQAEDSGAIVASHNLTNALSDPLAHAEYLCVKTLIENKTPLDNLTFYVTLEPCAMCAGVLERINAKVVFGYHNDIFGTRKILDKSCGTCMNDERCVELLKRFYKTPNKNTASVKSIYLNK